MVIMTYRYRSIDEKFHSISLKKKSNIYHFYIDKTFSLSYTHVYVNKLNFLTQSCLQKMPFKAGESQQKHKETGTFCNVASAPVYKYNYSSPAKIRFSNVLIWSFSTIWYLYRYTFLTLKQWMIQSWDRHAHTGKCNLELQNLKKKNQYVPSWLWPVLIINQ